MIQLEARPYRAALAREQRISSVRPWSRVSVTVSGAMRATLNVDRQGEPKAMNGLCTDYFVASGRASAWPGRVGPARRNVP